MVLNIQVIAILLFLVIGVGYGATALTFTPAAFGNPHAPKIYPLIIAGGTIALSLLLLVEELVRQKAGKAQAKARFKPSENGKLIAFVSALCIAYAFAFEPAGYMVSTTLYIAAIMLYLSKGKKILQAAVTGVVFSVSVYLLFHKVLSVTLPVTPFIDF